MDTQEKYAVVFGGGGIRGAYEAGVWDAIISLGIPVGLVIGASIGSINATLAVQGADMIKLYNSITLQDVVPNDSLNPEKDIFELENLIKTLKGVVKEKGYSTDNLRKTIYKYIDFDKIYSSEIDLGIVTCTTPLTPIVKYKKDIPQNELVDHILASCGFPIFKRQTIDGKKCIDGGFWDNVPVNAAIDKGYKKIISVDLRSVGNRRPTKKTDATIISIRAPKKTLGGLFEINRETINQNIGLGYADANVILRTAGII